MTKIEARMAIRRRERGVRWSPRGRRLRAEVAGRPADLRGVEGRLVAAAPDRGEPVRRGLLGALPGRLAATSGVPARARPGRP
ncbi:hypothetical protein GCM10009657_24820 [Oryzihumus leptocrescens]